MDPLKFVDDNGEWYEFWFVYDDWQEEHYVEIICHYSPTSWRKIARRINPFTRVIEWENTLLQTPTLLSTKARAYIEKVYKNKAFL